MDVPLDTIGCAMTKVWWIDSTVAVTLTAEQTDGHAGMWLWEARRGAAAPLHVHSREDEQFLVIDGEVRFVIDGQETVAGPGETVIMPCGVPHAYVVTSPTARIVGSVTPGGFEGFFTALGTPVTDDADPQPGPAVPQLAEASADFGVQVLGPPPAL
jgi:quercetin dioxygenase-like cupin family protein